MAFPSDLVRTKNWGTEILTDADLEGQLDLIIDYVMAALDGSAGHNHDGASNQSMRISPANLLIASQATGDLLYASSATAWARLGKGAALKYLKMNSGGTLPEWGDGPTQKIVQVVNTQTGASTTGSTAIPDDNSIPQNTEGDEYMTLAVTPTSATNKLRIDVVCLLANSGGSAVRAALFQDSTADALAAGRNAGNTAGAMVQVSFTHYMTAGTTSSTTFKVRGGGDGGTTTFNGSGGTRLFGGVAASSITITEVTV
jgi:hypothetical protein